MMIADLLFLLISKYQYHAAISGAGIVPFQSILFAPVAGGRIV
jgi:hypothetical protein